MARPPVPAPEPPDVPVGEAPPRPLTGGAVMTATGRVTVAVTGALTTIFVARLLGPEGAGGFAIALTVVLLLTTFSTLGVEHGVAYYVSSRRWAARDAFAAVQRVALAAGLVAGVVGVVARLALPSAFGGLSVASVALLAAAMPFALSWFYVGFVLLATDRYEGYVLPPAAQSAGALLFIVALSIPFGLTGAVVGLVASHVLAALGTSALARRRLPHDTAVDPEPHALRRAMSFGAKGYAANALQFLNFRLDLFILSAVVSTAAVGQYSVALAVTQVMWLLPQALGEVLFPRVAALSAGRGADDEEVRAFVEAKSLRHTVLVVVVGTLGLAAALLLLVVPVYGADFRPAIELGLILLPGVALIGMGTVLSASIVGRGKPIYSLITALIVTPLTIGAYVVLVPVLEAEGAALAKTLSYTANFALTVFFYRRLTGRAGPRLFLPTRSELADLRALPGAVREWAAGLRRRGGAART